jgi:hypothetical protein
VTGDCRVRKYPFDPKDLHVALPERFRPVVSGVVFESRSRVSCSVASPCPCHPHIPTSTVAPFGDGVRIGTLFLSGTQSYLGAGRPPGVAVAVKGDQRCRWCAGKPVEVLARDSGDV